MRKFIFDFVARPARASSSWVAALNHEAVNHAMKNNPIVKSLLHEFLKVAGSNGHVRINLDTLTAMEIDAKSGQKAVINAKGEPEIVQIDRTQYIRENFIVDMTSEVSIPANVIIPSGMKMRGLARKK